MKRKLLATLLALCLIVGMIPVAASAEIIRVEDTETLWNEETASFRIYDDYWSDIVAEIPEGYVQDKVQKTVQLSTPESLVWFGKEVNSGKSFAGYTITVTNDIDMSGHYWTPIDTATIQYNDENGSWSTIEPQKKLDGATITGGEEGHTITGLATSTGLRGPNQSSEPGDGQNCYYYSAFIGRNDGALTVQNLTFENASIAMTEPDDGVASNGSSMCATVVALNSGTLTLDSVSVVGSNILAMQKAAALVAYTTSSLVVQQCEVADNTISAYFQVAPVVGYSAKNNLSLKGIVLNNNTIRAIEQQGDSWNYTIDEEGNQYYQYGNDNLWYYNAGEVAVFYDGESDSSTNKGSGLEMVAEANGYQYSTIQSAIESAEAGEIVTLLKDTKESVNIASDNDIVLDLNGYVLTLTDTMKVDGNLTVQDNTVTTGPIVSSDYESVEYDAGKIVYTGNATAIIPQNGGSFTLLSGIIDASAAGTAIYANGNQSPENDGDTAPVNSKVTIADGYVHSMEYGIGVAGRGAQLSVTGGVIAAEGNCAIGGNGTNSASRYDGGTTINISGGTIIGRMTAEFVEDGYIAVGIYHPQNGEMTISGGTIYADQGVGIAMRGGTLDFIGGSIISTGSASGKVGDSKVAMDCYGIQVDGDSGYYDYANCEVTISGSASVSSQSGVDSIIVTPAGDEDKITVSGGYFTSDPSAYLADDLVAVPSDMPGYAFTVGDKPEVQDVEPATGDPAVDLSQIPENQQESVKEAVSSVKDSGELAAAANAKLNDAANRKEAAIEAYKNSGIEGASAATDVNVYAQTYLSITPTAYDSTNKTLTMGITPMYRVVASTEENPEDIKVVGEVGENEQPNAVVLENSEKELNIRTMTITLTLPTDFVSENSTVYIQHKGYEYNATADATGKITFTNPHGFSEFTFSTERQAVAEIDGTSYTSLQAAVDDATSDDIIVVKKDTDDLSATANKTVAIRNETNDVINVTINGVSKTIEANETETFVYTSGGGTPSEPEEPTWPFTDVTEGDDWFYDAVAYVYENGIMAGTDETTFEPYMELDRAMAAQLFYNLEGKPVVTGDSTFTDVTSGHWAVDAITWAAQNDIVAGIGGGLYDPDSNVTREQFAQMLYNYARFKGYDLTATGDLTRFPDAGSISSWAETALSWANGNELINGHENGTIDPKGRTIRAQAASIMANFDQNVAK